MKCLSCLLALVLAMLFADTAQAGGGGGLAFRQRSQRIVIRERVSVPAYYAPPQFRAQLNFNSGYYAPPAIRQQLQFSDNYCAPPAFRQQLGGYCDPGAGQFNSYSSSQLRLRFGGY